VAEWLAREYGPTWVQVADDLDNAIAEWGHYVQGKIDERLHDFEESVREMDAERRRSMGKAAHKFKPTKIGREELTQLRDEVWLYHVRDIVRRYMGDPSGRYERVVWEKKATGDPLIDADWNEGHVTITPQGRPRVVRRTREMRR